MSRTTVLFFVRLSPLFISPFPLSCIFPFRYVRLASRCWILAFDRCVSVHAKYNDRTRDCRRHHRYRRRQRQRQRRGWLCHVRVRKRGFLPSVTEGNFTFVHSSPARFHISTLTSSPRARARHTYTPPPPPPRPFFLPPSRLRPTIKLH